MIDLRCSRLPLVTLCGAASVSPGVSVDSWGNDAAMLGTAAHEYWTSVIRGRFDPVADPEGAAILIASMADKYVEAISYRELDIICRLLWGAWRQVSHLYPEPMVEQVLHYTWREQTLEAEGEIHLSGHTDVVSLVDRNGAPEIRICDAKTGFRDDDHLSQLLGYALLWLQNMPEVATVYATILRPREGTYDAWRWTRAEVLAWWNEAAWKILRQEEYHPGRHCGHCPRVLECPAAAGFYRQAIRVVRELPSVPLTLTNSHDITQDCRAVAPETLRTVHDARKLVEALCTDAAQWERAIVEGLGGSASLGDGRRLEIRQAVKEREILLTEAGETILADALGDRLRDALKVRKSRVEDIVKETAPPRGKGKAVAALMDRLQEAGALVTTYTERLEEKRDGTSNSTPGIEADVSAAAGTGAAG